jgi:hypothetical protein
VAGEETQRLTNEADFPHSRVSRDLPIASAKSKGSASDGRVVSVFSREAFLRWPMRERQGRTMSLPCAMVVWNGATLCEYHDKIEQGLLEPSDPSLRPPGWTPAKRPSVAEAFEREGWTEIDVNLYELLSAGLAMGGCENEARGELSRAVGGAETSALGDEPG